MPTLENSPEIIAEAKRRVQKFAPNLTDEQWDHWLAQVEARGGRIVLQLDSARAECDPTDFQSLVSSQIKPDS